MSQSSYEQSGPETTRDTSRDDTPGPDDTEPAPPPSEALQGYPPEASPQADEDTEPVQVVGEQVDPGRRLDVFPEDEGTTPPV